MFNAIPINPYKSTCNFKAKLTYRYSNTMIWCTTNFIVINLSDSGFNTRYNLKKTTYYWMFIDKVSKRATLNVLESFEIQYKYTVQVQ